MKLVKPTMEGVIDMVTKVGNTWQLKRERGKRGRAMACFNRLCGTLDSHRNMLDVVPRGNKYVSIFADTITSIIKVR
ncbi:hypothetical protein CC78DRAFT_593177 [Lojkania enalia]|uniref:Uncharacterized protein n=1 Tax=Lojkania enalia TaxID=147567 RepID=A0A9P4N1R9_9PLEO|nr:hypothetical protein CC78DRAFT_593177 [Didymosphaeria enalia]